MRKITSGNKSKGQATLEMLLVLMVLLPLFFGGIELARAVSLRSALDGGVFVATRAISLNPTDTAYAQSLVQDAVNNNVFRGGTTANLNLGTITWDAVTCATGKTLGCRFDYTATIDYTPWLPLIGGQKITINIRHHGIVEKLY
jgi:Flp pilus assembly protein TadG